MKTINVRCGCGQLVKVYHIPDDSNKVVIEEYAGECEKCYVNGDYYKNRRWKDDAERK